MSRSKVGGIKYPKLGKSVKGGYALMKKIFAIFVSVLFFASLSLAVVGCKKAEEQKQEAAKKVEENQQEEAKKEEAKKNKEKQQVDNDEVEGEEDLKEGKGKKDGK